MSSSDAQPSSSAHASGGVVVVGSANADITMHLDRRPGAGETVVATRTLVRAGGKGANQAAAAARAGARVWFVGAVGADDLGADQLRALRRAAVDVTLVHTVTDASTGTAFITVTPDGENSIVVTPGANALLDADAATGALDRIPVPAVVLAQTEIPGATIAAIAAWCVGKSVRFVLNNGPYRELPDAALRAADPLVLNEHEAREMCAQVAGLAGPAIDPRDAAGSAGTADPFDPAAACLAASGAKSVLVTLGSKGVLVGEGAASVLIQGVPVDRVVDTTGAGDAFVGTLAALLADGHDLEGAARAATDAAARSVTWPGARPPD